MNFLKKLNYSKSKTIILALFLLFSLTITPINAPKAQALWGEFPAQIYKTLEEQLTASLQGMIRGGLKTAAIKAINSALGDIVGGSSSQSAKFIVNWQDFLVNQPKESANILMNDYLSQTISQGRGSASGYISAASASLLADNYEGFGKGSFNYGLAMNNPSYGKFSYFAQAASDLDVYRSAATNAFELQEMGKALTSERKEPTITYNGEDIADASNNFANLQLSYSGINDQWDYAINAQRTYDRLLTEETKKAENKAQAGSGFAEAGDKVVTPGIITKDAVSNALNTAYTTLATATNPGEIITATVQSLITNTIQYGIGQAKSSAQNTTDKAMSGLNTQASQSGIGSLFKN
jgi:hypothetical protein